jgi:hypothetical protein
MPRWKWFQRPDEPVDQVAGEPTPRKQPSRPAPQQTPSLPPEQARKRRNQR